MAASRHSMRHRPNDPNSIVHFQSVQETSSQSMDQAEREMANFGIRYWTIDYTDLEMAR
jgi:hypothetical protein